MGGTHAILDIVVVREADRLSAAEVTEVLARAKHGRRSNVARAG